MCCVTLWPMSRRADWNRLRSLFSYLRWYFSLEQQDINANWVYSKPFWNYMRSIRKGTIDLVVLKEGSAAIQLIPDCNSEAILAGRKSIQLLINMQVIW